MPETELTEAEERQRTELWRRLEQASEMLLDPHSRRSYDERLRGARAQPLVGEHEADPAGEGPPDQLIESSLHQPFPFRLR